MSTLHKTTARRKPPVKGALHSGNTLRTSITLPRSWEGPLNDAKRKLDQNFSQLSRAAIERICREAGVTLPSA